MELLSSLGPFSFALMIATAFVAGMARGFSGFGAALIFVPVASALVGPRVAAPVLLIVDFISGLGMIPNAWRLADRRDVATMGLGAMVGVPLGAYLLAISDPVTLRWAIIALVFCLLALLASGWRYHGRPKTPLTIGVGALAGLFSGAAQVGGPPVVAYWLGGANSHQKVRANIVLYFLISTIFSAISYFAGGLFVWDVFVLSLVCVPVFAVGLWLGTRMFGRTNEATFRRICFLLIGSSAVLGLPVWDSLRG